MDRVAYWDNKVHELEASIEEAKISGASDEDIIDLQIALHEAECNLNYAWQDDELDSLGLPHPYGW